MLEIAQLNPTKVVCPSIDNASIEPNSLLAVGGNLNVSALINAYIHMADENASFQRVIIIF